MRYLAIDYGIKRTGLAICDAAETIASPLTIIQGRKHLIKKITDIIVAENVEAVVIGLPLNMDDSEGPQAKAALQFGRGLKAETGISIYFQDERLTTFGADKKLAGAGFSRKKKSRRLDAVAAAQILEAFLETKKSK